MGGIIPVFEKLHKRNGSCKILIGGNIYEQQWRFNGKKHRTVSFARWGPARKMFYLNGDLMLQEYFFNGKLHRISLGMGGGPASTCLLENGFPREIIYACYGKKHRNFTEGPAVISYFDSTQYPIIKYEKWYTKNKLHRPLVGPGSGPAVIRYWLSSLNIRDEEWWTHGKFLHKVRIENIPNHFIK